MLESMNISFNMGESFGNWNMSNDDRVLSSAHGKVIADKADVGFENFKNRYIIGDPAFAIEQLPLYRDAEQLTEVVCWLHLPGINGENAMRSVELFVEELMPHFQ